MGAHGRIETSKIIIVIFERYGTDVVFINSNAMYRL